MPVSAARHAGCASARNGRKAGRRKVLVEIGPDDEDTLMTVGALGEWDLEDRKAIGRAIEALLALVRANSSE